MPKKTGNRQSNAEKTKKTAAVQQEQEARNGDTPETSGNEGCSQVPQTNEVPANPPKTFTEEEVAHLVEEATRKAVAAALEAQRNTAPQIVHVAADEAKVVMRFQSECSKDNRIDFGPNGMFGSIQGQSGTLTVAKSDWTGRFRDNVVQALLASRELVVLSGLTDEEREIYGVNYYDGEIMEPKVFATMINMGKDLIAIFPDLCVAHKEMVARRFTDAYERGDGRVTRELVTKLNQISKKDYRHLPEGDVRRKGAFAYIIEQMNRMDIS